MSLQEISAWSLNIAAAAADMSLRSTVSLKQISYFGICFLFSDNIARSTKLSADFDRKGLYNNVEEDV